MPPVYGASRPRARRRRRVGSGGCGGTGPVRRLFFTDRSSATAPRSSMYVLPELPYGYDALAPLISRDTLHTHHDKHHKTYVEKTNELAAQAGLAGRPLEEVVREADRRENKTLFNNAAQAWNHAF